MSDEKALREILNWIKTKKNQTEKDPESVRWLSYLFIGNNTDPPQLDTGSRYSSILCFIISTLIVFIFSLVVALAALRCYDFYRTRSQVPLRSLCSSPPSYDTVAKIDKTELPTYQQACQYYPAKV